LHDYKTIKAVVKTAKREEAHIQVILAAAELAAVVEETVPSADSVELGESVCSVSEADSVGVAETAAVDSTLKVAAVTLGVLATTAAEAATQYAVNLLSSVARLMSFGH